MCSWLWLGWRTVRWANPAVPAEIIELRVTGNGVHIPMHGVATRGMCWVGSIASRSTVWMHTVLFSPRTCRVGPLRI